MDAVFAANLSSQWAPLSRRQRRRGQALQRGDAQAWCRRRKVQGQHGVGCEWSRTDCRGSRAGSSGARRSRRPALAVYDIITRRAHVEQRHVAHSSRRANKEHPTASAVSLPPRAAAPVKPKYPDNSPDMMSCGSGRGSCAQRETRVSSHCHVFSPLRRPLCRYFHQRVVGGALPRIQERLHGLGAARPHRPRRPRRHRGLNLCPAMHCRRQGALRPPRARWPAPPRSSSVRMIGAPQVVHPLGSHARR